VTILLPTGTSLIVLLLGLTLLVGFGADWLANRFRVPDVLWLIGLGILAGPILGLIGPSSLLVIAPVLGVTALILILFDAGIDLRLSQVRPLARSAILFAFAAYVVSTAVLFVVAYGLLFPNHPILSLLFAASLGCTSGAVIIPLATRLGLTAGLRSLLHLDAAVEDAVAVVTVTTILALTVPTASSLAINLTISLVLPLPVGIAIGFAGGVIWLFFLYEWQDRPFAALATLGFLFVVYGVAEVLGGSGILAALVFGGVLGNEELVRRSLRRTRPFTVARDLRKVEVEIAFVLRTFFLFLIGVIVLLSNPGIVVGATMVGLVGGLLLVRRAIFPATTDPAVVPRSWSDPMTAFYGRGLTSAVLLIFSLEYSSAVTRLFLPALLLIVGTNVAMTVLLFVHPPRNEPSAAPIDDRWAASDSDVTGLDSHSGLASMLSLGDDREPAPAIVEPPREPSPPRPPLPRSRRPPPP
jgi:potassium/hydrogen antiporter